MKRALFYILLTIILLGIIIGSCSIIHSDIPKPRLPDGGIDIDDIDVEIDNIEDTKETQEADPIEEID